MASDYNENLILGKHFINFICSGSFGKVTEPVFLTKSAYR